MLTTELLKTNLSYDMATGLFTRLRTSGGMVKGSIAGLQSSRSGYLQIKICGKAYMTHRVVWFYVHGEWPKHDNDHIDGKKSNNKIANLRQATRSQNLQNLRKPRIDNRSGLLGVRFREDVKRWYAQITINGDRHSLGGFGSAIDAHFAYLSAKQQLHPFNTIPATA